MGMRKLFLILLVISFSVSAQPPMRKLIGVNPCKDPAISKYLAATGITDPTYKSALCTLVKTLKGNGAWANIQALYILVNGTQGQCSYNLIDTSTFKLSWTGTFNYNIHGAKPTSGGYANTGYNFTTNGKISSASISFYSYDSIRESSTDVGARGSTYFFDLELYNNIAYYSYYTGTSGYRSPTPNIPNMKGFWYAGLDSAKNLTSIWNNGVESDSTSYSSVGRPNSNCLIWTSNNVNYSTKRASIASIGYYLQYPKSYYLALNQFLTTIGALP